MTSRMLQIPITRIVSICWAQQSHNLSIAGQHKSVQRVSLPFTKYPIASHSSSNLISYAKPIASIKSSDLIYYAKPIASATNSDLISMPTLLLQPRKATPFSTPILFCFLVLQTQKVTFWGQTGMEYLSLVPTISLISNMLIQLNFNYQN